MAVRVISRRVWLNVLLTAATLLLPACRVTDLPIWSPTGPLPDDACAVEHVRGVAYRDGPEAEGCRSRVDIFRPKGQANCPVAIVVHGGAWIMGDNRCCGLYSSVGEFLASRGIVAVLPNYRLSPRVKHPQHAQDLARAVAWTQAHIAEYGGCPEQLFLVGHSAGGHLAALLATDEKYLRAEGLDTADIRGVVAVSGVYRIPEGELDLTWSGDSDKAFRLDEVLPVRGGGRRRLHLPGIPMKVNVFGPIFGNEPQARADASPINHVRPGLPPFLLFNADNDLPMLPDMTREFCRVLQDNGCEARQLLVADRNHNSLMFRAVAISDPVAQNTVNFIWQHAAGVPPTTATGTGQPDGTNSVPARRP